VDQNEAKRLAAEAALHHLPERGIVGLGSGSTAKLFIEAVARLTREGRSIIGVPTSEESRQLAQLLGIPLLTDEGPWSIEVCVDGADEVSPILDLIKGGGGYHTREKVVNAASKINVIIVDETKLVSRLGERFAVPVEVLSFGHHNTAKTLARFGEAKIRLVNGRPFRTDEGSYIYDVRVGPIEDPRALDQALSGIPGVVSTGLFVGRADIVLVAGPKGVRELRRPT
jgi:ribose 5-phosphate isomerase A